MYSKDAASAELLEPRTDGHEPRGSELARLVGAAVLIMTEEETFIIPTSDSAVNLEPAMLAASRGELLPLPLTKRAGCPFRGRQCQRLLANSTTVATQHH